MAEPEEAEPEAAAAPAPVKASGKAATGQLPTTTAEKIAYCQRVDAK